MSQTIAEDLLLGAEAIAGHIGCTKRQAVYMLETKKLPAFKIGSQWRMRKSTFQTHIEKLEAEAMETVAKPRDRVSL